MKPITITMYRWAGKKFGIKIRNECEECEINTGILEDMEKKEFSIWPIKIEIKPWLTNFWESLFHGGWHAPVILVNGRIFSQGIVINRDKLYERVQKEFNKRK